MMKAHVLNEATVTSKTLLEPSAKTSMNVMIKWLDAKSFNIGENIDINMTLAFADGDPLNIPTKISKNYVRGGFIKPPFSLQSKIDMKVRKCRKNPN